MSSSKSAEHLTYVELESLKKFTMTWIGVYNFMPPKEMLALYVAVHRIAQRIIEMQKAVATINIAQAPTVSNFHAQAIANIQRSRSMMR